MLLSLHLFGSCVARPLHLENMYFYKQLAPTLQHASRNLSVSKLAAVLLVCSFVVVVALFQMRGPHSGGGEMGCICV